MTNEILNMSKEELINTISEADKLGKELNTFLEKLAEERDELLSQADELEMSIRRGISRMQTLATAIAEMRKRLRDDFDCHVI